jgi:hypothetical protein
MEEIQLVLRRESLMRREKKFCFKEDEMKKIRAQRTLG